MMYEFDQPYVIDSSEAESSLGLSPTPIDQAIDHTMRWYWG